MPHFHRSHQQQIDQARDEAIRIAQQSNTSVGGIMIALAVIGLLFLSLSLFFGGTTNDRPQAPVVDQTTSDPVSSPSSTE